MARWHSLGLIIALLSIFAGAMQALQSQDHQLMTFDIGKVLPGSLLRA